MWLLECDGDAFGGKRLWLKPGVNYVLGRTAVLSASDERILAIKHKSISRRHLILRVDQIKPGQGSEIYARSKLSATDGSKVGTTLDGVQFANDTKVLGGPEHKIVLGHHEHSLKIFWHPVVLSLHRTDKEIKRSPNALRAELEKLERFDVKLAIPYIIDATTHFITEKRNVPSSLQALINGKYIATNAYVDAIAAACAARGSAQEPLPSLLEEDFTKHWPNAMLHLPNPGKEPHPRAPEKFAPDARRISIFEGFTFVFGEKAQFEMLRAALTNGGAKTLLFDIKIGKTTAKEFVEFVHNVARAKGLDDINDANVAKGVIVVRFRAKDGHEEWAFDLLERIDLSLGQRSVDTSEFLDAILQIDARPLKRPLEEASQDHAELSRVQSAVRSRPRSPIVQENPAPTIQNSNDRRRSASPKRIRDGGNDSDSRPQVDSQQSITKGKFRRLAVKSRFKGFDDFDEDDKEDVTAARGSHDPVKRSEALGTRTLPSQDMDVDDDSQPLFVRDSPPRDRPRPDATTEPAKSPRKRPHVDDDEEPDSTAMLQKLLPGVAAAKRRRLVQEAEDAALGTSSLLEPVDPDDDDADSVGGDYGKSKRKSARVDVLDVREAVRSHAVAMDAARTRDEGAVHDHDDAMHPAELAGLRNLAVVEEMDVPVRRPPRAAQRAGPQSGGVADASNGNDCAADGRWDERWNGLPNFKNFRRKGEGASSAARSNRARKVIVGLEEWRQKDYGLGDEYWLENPVRNGSRRTAGGDGSERHRGDSSNSVAFDDEEDVVNGQATWGDGAREAERSSRSGGENSQLAAVPDAAITSANGASAGRKRPPATGSALRSEPAAKKQRSTRSAPTAARRQAEDESTDDDDQLKFRLRRG